MPAACRRAACWSAWWRGNGQGGHERAGWRHEGRAVSAGAQPLRVRVAARTVEAEDICSFELVAVDGRALPAYAAGSHIDVQVAGLTRQYSLCNDPREAQRYQIAVLRDPASRGGSAALHDRVRLGDTLAISAPRNHFALAPEAERHLLLAGGIGITPILCMAERLALQGADFEMHYCTRARARTAFAQRIAGAPYAARVAMHFDDGPAG
ncbi:MAG: ferredoxin reductase, partial [Burkholderiales bacterium]|nr:ferredoxin reductase [Burkholderiales bacterium]